MSRKSSTMSSALVIWLNSSTRCPATHAHTVDNLAALMHKAEGDGGLLMHVELHSSTRNSSPYMIRAKGAYDGVTNLTGTVMLVMTNS